MQTLDGIWELTKEFTVLADAVMADEIEIEMSWMAVIKPTAHGIEWAVSVETQHFNSA